MPDKQSKEQPKGGRGIINDKIKKHQFKPGESGNPLGRRKKGNAWSDIINEMVDANEVSITITDSKGKKNIMQLEVDTNGKTIRHVIIFSWIRKAMSGNISACKALADYTVGRPVQLTQLTGEDNEDIKIIVEHIGKKSQGDNSL